VRRLFFQNFKQLVELQLGFKVKNIQSDWGGEYRPFTSLLTCCSINHRLVCPHTHHQNDVFERKQKHIVDVGLTLLHKACLPLQFWDYAFTTAIYLINRLPTACLNFAIPYSILFNKDPDFAFLKNFGCACFPLLKPYHSHKLDFKSEECIFLGYSQIYKCLSSSGRLYISKDV